MVGDKPNASRLAIKTTMTSAARSPDRHLLARVRGKTLETYRAAGRKFVDWALRNHRRPWTPDEWDDALADYKREAEEEDEQHLSYANFVATVAVVEFFFPRLKGKLQVSHAIIKGWGISHVTRHTVPMGRGACALMCVYFSTWGAHRLGVGCVLQGQTGMRPSEMLGLRGADVSFPEDRGEDPQRAPVLIGLGVRAGTKLKRAQAAIIQQVGRESLVAALRELCAATPPDEPLFPYRLETYRKMIRKVEETLQVNIGWGPHSPRAGYATDARADGQTFEEIREGGRWQADTSLRTYLDVVQAASIALTLKSAGLAPSFAAALVHWPWYVRAGAAQDAAQRSQAVGRWDVDARGDRRRAEFVVQRAVSKVTSQHAYAKSTAAYPATREPPADGGRSQRRAEADAVALPPLRSRSAPRPPATGPELVRLALEQDSDDKWRDAGAGAASRCIVS